MIKYISEFSSLNFIEDWQTDFDQAECYAQPFTTGDIIKIHALSTTGDGETAYLKVTNVDTGEEKEVSCQNTGVRSGEYWIVEYNIEYSLEEGVYQVYLMDKIDKDDYYVRDVNHNGNSYMMFKIISAEKARNTVKLMYTNRENNFDTAFNDWKTVHEEIDSSDRWGTNLIIGGAHYEIPVSVLNNIPIVTPNVTNDAIDLLGWSHDVVKDKVFVGGNYYEQELMNGLAFVVQYDEIHVYDHNNNEIILPDGTIAGTFILSDSYKAGSQQFDDSTVGDIVIGSSRQYSLFIPPTKTINGVNYPVTYTDKYGANASGWFFGLSMTLGGGVVPNGIKVVFTNLLIAPITAAEYNELQPGELIAWSQALEEMYPGSVYFDFRVEGGFLPSERTFASESGDFRDQRYTPTQLSSRPYQKKTLCIGGRKGVPYWVGKKINQIFSCSFVEVNDVEHVRSENAEPQINPVADLYPLMVYKIDLEEKENYKTTMKYVKIQKPPQPYITIDGYRFVELFSFNSSSVVCSKAERVSHVYMLRRTASGNIELKEIVFSDFVNYPPYGYALLDVEGFVDPGIINIYQFLKRNDGTYFMYAYNTDENYRWYKSPDAKVWTMLPPPPVNNYITYCTTRYLGEYFFTFYGNILYRTQDFETWVNVWTLDTTYATGVALCNDGTLFVASNNNTFNVRIRKSTDYGETWSDYSTIARSAYNFCIHDVIKIDGVYYLCSASTWQRWGQLYRSNDGIAWELVRELACGIIGIIYDGSAYYIFTSEDFWKTTDFLNYEQIDTNFVPTRFAQSFILDGENYLIWNPEGIMWASYGHKVYPEE
jgi:hypothetical protein